MSFSGTYKNLIYSYCIERLGMFDYTKGWIKGDCPFCGKEKKFGVHIGRNECHCFVCEERLPLFNMVMEIENLTSINEVKALLTGYDSFEYKEPKINNPYDEVVGIDFPEGYKSLYEVDNTYGRIISHYLVGRGFSIPVLASKGYGYCVEGRYTGSIVIPYYSKGRLVYFTTRRVIGSGTKYDNVQSEVAKIGKSMLIYNQDALDIYEKVMVLEGAFNAETMGDNAVALGGKSIGEHQLFDIMKSKVKKVIIILDPDAIKYAINIALEFVYHKDIKVVVLPEGKDANDLGRNRTMIKVYKSRWLKYNDLLKLKHQYK